MSGLQDKIPPPPPPQETQQTPTKQTPQIVSTIKLPILKKGEYDIWAMKIEHYLAHTGRIQFGMLSKMGLNAIKSRFGGNDESKKMQKYILKQQFEGFTVSNTDGIHKGYERFMVFLINGNRTGKKEESKALVTVDGESVDWTTHSEDDENFAFMASNSSGSDTQVTSCSNECKESYANLKRLYDAQREQLSDASVEIKAYTQGLKKVEAQLVAHQQGQLWYEQKIKFMKIDLDDKTDVLTYHKKLLAKAQKEKEDLEVIVDKWNHSSKNLVSEPVINESNIEVQPKVWSDAPIIEEYESDSDDEHVCVQTKGLYTPSFANKQVKTPRENVKNQSTHSQKPKAHDREQGLTLPDFMTLMVACCLLEVVKLYTGKGKIKLKITTRCIFNIQSYDNEDAEADFTYWKQLLNAKEKQYKGLSSFFICLLSYLNHEPKKISEALEDESWVDAMQEELLQFEIQKVWILVDLPYGKKAIGTKWVYRNKKDEKRMGFVRNIKLD
ncbi:hypothetical protein Tco_1371325 [Tanacetum coccineum]